MSLQVDDTKRRGRSRSPSGRDRSRSRGPINVVDAVPYPSDDRDPSTLAYEYERLASWRPVTPGAYPEEPGENPSHHSSRDRLSQDALGSYADGGRVRAKERARSRERDSSEGRGNLASSFKYLPQKYAQKMADFESPRQSRDSLRDRGSDREKRAEAERETDRDRERAKDRRRRDKLDEDLAYGTLPPPKPESSSASKYTYADVKAWDYSKPDPNLNPPREDPRYSTSSLHARQPSAPRIPSPGPQYAHSGDPNRYDREPYPGGDPARLSANVLTVEPGSRPRKSSMKRGTSPQPPTARMSSLTVDMPHRPGSLSAAPASPLLESYRGTYQSMSPMPSPMFLPTHPGGLEPQIHEALSPAGSEDERSGDRRRSRRARFHDPVEDAARLAKALKGERRAPETEPLIEILPGLTHEQVMDLRVEYKRLVKTGSQHRGVNVAKHIRSRLKDEDPSLMKACYAVALGRWESEAYWANFWYQGDKTRRELLIESLMGRTNDEIRAIKDGFSDKKYGNSLTKCMKTELKEDKFKKAVLLALDEQRMDEADAYGRPLRLDHDLVRDDVKRLHHAVRSERGGETLMITTVVQRSDGHLREVMRVYADTYGSNFAKDALRKSGNLVGELLAHILNGVINKPVRDAMLVQHALTASRKDELRRELLISRLVRYHWDRHHMTQVKAAFYERYGKDLQQAVRDGSSGEWGEFCQALCITRMPDDVKRV